VTNRRPSRDEKSLLCRLSASPVKSIRKCLYIKMNAIELSLIAFFPRTSTDMIS
jgi:hypothetical protein